MFERILLSKAFAYTFGTVSIAIGVLGLLAGTDAWWFPMAGGLAIFAVEWTNS